MSSGSTRSGPGSPGRSRPIQRYGDFGGKYLETAETIARMLKLAGLKIHKKRFKEAGLKFGVVANFEIEEKVWEALREKWITPEEVYKLTEEGEDEETIPF